MKTSKENRRMVRQWAGITDSRIPICVVRLSMDRPWHSANSIRSRRIIYVGAAWLASQGIEMSDMDKKGKPMMTDAGYVVIGEGNYG